MRTAVVILNWNTRELLEKFLPSLLKSMPEGAEVIVADNASTDGSMEMLSEKFPGLRQIRFDKNYGFTGGYNKAFEAVCSMDGGGGMEYFLLINSDIEVSQGWLEPLMEWMDKHPDCAACAPKLHSCQDKDSFEYAGAAGGLLDRFGYPFCRGRVMKRVELDHGQYDEPSDVFWATGACLIVRRKAYSEMGGLDERFFAHMEEIDLCWRLQLDGGRICVVPSSTVWHVGGGTLPNDSPWKLKLNYRNNLLMLQNNLAKTYSLEEIADHEPDKAAQRACLRAKRTIFARKCLDLCSAAVYLATGKLDCFKAVLEAHKEARAMGHEPDRAEVEAYASSHKGLTPPRLFSKWIVLAAMMRKDGIFEYLRKSGI